MLQQTDVLMETDHGEVELQGVRLVVGVEEQLSDAHDLAAGGRVVGAHAD